MAIIIKITVITIVPETFYLVAFDKCCVYQAMYCVSLCMTYK